MNPNSFFSFSNSPKETMFTYPLTFNSEEEHIQHVTEYQKFYRDVLDMKESNEELDEQIKRNQEMSQLISKLTAQMTRFEEEKKKQEDELKKTKELLEDTTRLEDLLNKKNGISVVHKGICDEKYVEIVLKEVASEKYIVDNGDGTKKMDVRLIRKDGQFTIGIECKDKDKVSKADIEKFRRDKVLNKFRRSIFISTTPIKNLVEEDNQVLINGDEMFVVTNDHVFLAAVMKLYLANLECEKDQGFEKNMVFDSIIDTYNTWQATKKQHLKLDQSFLRMLNLTPDFEKNVKGHVYLGVASKFKSDKTPY
jgi:hypothetical protein